MKHLGDITQLNGGEIPKVDIITGGSPCQDLSVAGKREGLAGERSGLFMEQIRLIKEMRESDRANGRTNEHIRPRYMVWENVPGAFSSNKGEDFRCVLEETAKVADENAIIPRLETGKDGKQKWSKAGVIMGGGWSIAWRVHDAQFWGVPQRRKRISLVADFGGATAPEILFERESLSRDTTESGKPGESAATDVGSGIEETSRAISFQERAGKPGGGKGILIQNERTGALSTLNNQSVCAFEPGAASRVGGHVYEDGVAGTVRANAGDNQQAVVYGIGSYDSNAMKSDNPHSGIYEADTSRTLDLNGGNPGCNQGGMAVVQGFDAYNQQMTGEVTKTLNAIKSDADHVPVIMQGADVYNGELTGETASTLTSACGGSNTSGAKVVCLEGNGQRDSHKGDGAEGKGIAFATVGDHDGRPTDMTNLIQSESVGAVCQSVVRRLTPLECERLQGYPDGWTDIGEWYDSKGKKRKDADSPRYKALGNSIALPFWQWMAERMRKYLGNEPTMASLFDGISGFCLVFARAGVKPVFSSEIEEFPIAVAKKHFGDDEKGVKGDYDKRFKAESEET